MGLNGRGRRNGGYEISLHAYGFSVVVGSPQNERKICLFPRFGCYLFRSSIVAFPSSVMRLKVTWGTLRVSNRPFQMSSVVRDVSLIYPWIHPPELEGCASALAAQVLSPAGSHVLSTSTWVFQIQGLTSTGHVLNRLMMTCHGILPKFSLHLPCGGPERSCHCTLMCAATVHSSRSQETPTIHIAATLDKPL